jgi:hypothetical protein
MFGAYARDMFRKETEDVSIYLPNEVRNKSKEAYVALDEDNDASDTAELLNII